MMWLEWLNPLDRYDQRPCSVQLANPPSLSASFGATRPPSRGASADKPDANVAALEQEIDARVYRLYGLTKDEIKLVEESAKK